MLGDGSGGGRNARRDEMQMGYCGDGEWSKVRKAVSHQKQVDSDVSSELLICADMEMDG